MSRAGPGYPRCGGCGGNGMPQLAGRNSDGYFQPRTQGLIMSWGGFAKQFSKVERGVVANSGGGFHHQLPGCDVTSSESRAARKSHFCFLRGDGQPFLRGRAPRFKRGVGVWRGTPKRPRQGEPPPGTQPDLLLVSGLPAPGGHDLTF